MISKYKKAPQSPNFKPAGHGEAAAIFLRKTDSDVSEMMGMVSKILKSCLFRDLTQMLYGQELTLTGESMNHLSTNLETYMTLERCLRAVRRYAREHGIMLL